MSKIALFLLIGGLACAQVMTREGPYFVRTLEKPVAGRIPSQLRIVTRGNVVLRGSKGDQVFYKLVQRTRAHSEAEADLLMAPVHTMTENLPGRTTLSLVPNSGPLVSIDVEVSVPKQVAVTMVQTQAGSVEAYDIDGSMQIVATLGIRVDRIHGSMNGRSASGEIRMGRVDGAVQCLSGGGSIFIDSVGGQAYCQTAGGEIIVKEAGGPLALTNVSGNIEVDHAASTVEAHTGEGVIEVNQAGGQVIADTRGGSIQIGSARGVKCESGAGAIRVRNITGQMSVQAMMGSILAELLAGARIDDSQLSASSGDVTVMIPARLSLSVVARNESGSNPRIQSDFSEVRGKTFGFSRSPNVAEGQINGGGPVLRINVASGIIYLRKQKQ